MASYFSGILDELMGSNRNLAPNDKLPEEKHWSDKNVCKYYICGFCPHTLFVNTKMSLVPCPNLHDDRLKEQYEKSDRYGKMNYEEKFLSYLQSLLSDCEKKIQRGYERLENGKRRSMELGLRLDDKTHKEVSEKIEKLLEEVSVLGKQGKVLQAQEAMTQLSELQKLRDGHRENAVLYYGQDKEMEICRVCGAFTLVNDTQTRIDDHMQGRQHAGFKRIREQVKKMTDTKYWLKKPQVRKEKEKEKEKEKTRVEKLDDGFRRVYQRKPQSKDKSDSYSNSPSERKSKKKKGSKYRSRSRSSDSSSSYSSSRSSSEERSRSKKKYDSSKQRRHLSKKSSSKRRRTSRSRSY